MHSTNVKDACGEGIRYEDIRNFHTNRVAEPPAQRLLTCISAQLLNAMSKVTVVQIQKKVMSMFGIFRDIHLLQP